MELISMQSEFSRAFLLTMVHSIWIGALCWLVLIAVLKLARKASNLNSYFYSRISLLIFLIINVLVFSFLYAPGQAESGEGLNDFILLSWIDLYADLQNKSGLNDVFYRAGLILYLAGLFIFLGRILLSYLKIRTLSKTGLDVEEKFESLVLKLSKKLSIGRKISLISHTDIHSPAVFGFLKPVIIVPAGMLSQMPFDQVEAIILHELYHLKQKDYLFNIFQMLLEALFFFNPFLWLLSARCREEREIRTDDRVLEADIGPLTYAKALYSISTLPLNQHRLLLQARGSNNKKLLYRVQRLLKTDNMKTNVNSRTYITALVFSGIVAFLTLTGFSKGFIQIDKGNTKDPVVAQKAETTYMPSKELHVKVTSDTEVESEQEVLSFPGKDTLTDKERKELIKQLEMELAAIKGIDWEKQKKDFERMQEEMMKVYPEKLHEQQLKMQEEFAAINQEEIKKQMETARKQLDSVMANFDKEKLEAELLANREAMKLYLEEDFELSESERKAIEESMKALEEIDFDDIFQDLEKSFKDMNMNFDFDFAAEINIDSLMIEVQEDLNSLNVNDIKLDIEATQKDIEERLRELKEGGEQKKQK